MRLFLILLFLAIIVSVSCYKKQYGAGKSAKKCSKKKTETGAEATVKTEKYGAGTRKKYNKKGEKEASVPTTTDTDTDPGTAGGKKKKKCSKKKGGKTSTAETKTPTATTDTDPGTTGGKKKKKCSKKKGGKTSTAETKTPTATTDTDTGTAGGKKKKKCSKKKKGGKTSTTETKTPTTTTDTDTDTGTAGGKKKKKCSKKKKGGKTSTTETKTPTTTTDTDTDTGTAGGKKKKKCSKKKKGGKTSTTETKTPTTTTDTDTDTGTAGGKKKKKCSKKKKGGKTSTTETKTPTSTTDTDTGTAGGKKKKKCSKKKKSGKTSTKGTKKEETCNVGGKTFKLGIFQNPYDVCSACDCCGPNGLYTCVRKLCQKTKCGKNLQKFTKDHCCKSCSPSCKGQWKKKKCWKAKHNCPEDRLAYKDNSCCPSCGCTSDGITYPPGQFGHNCLGCKCNPSKNKIKCKGVKCPARKLECVDPTFDNENDCNPICPNDMTCRHGPLILKYGQLVPTGNKYCACASNNWYPRAGCLPKTPLNPKIKRAEMHNCLAFPPYVKTADLGSPLYMDMP